MEDSVLSCNSLQLSRFLQNLLIFIEIPLLKGCCRSLRTTPGGVEESGDEGHANPAWIYGCSRLMFSQENEMDEMTLTLAKEQKKLLCPSQPPRSSCCTWYVVRRAEGGGPVPPFWACVSHFFRSRLFVELEKKICFVDWGRKMKHGDCCGETSPTRLGLVKELLHNS